MPDGRLDLLQLGHVEIEPHTLTGPGGALATLLAGLESDVLVPGHQMDRLPADGWRLVWTRPSRDHRAQSEVLAAPLPGQHGCWALVVLNRRDGRWVVTADPGPLQVYPGKAARRQGLVLGWPRPQFRRRAGTPLKLVIKLQNTRQQAWHNLCDDSAYVAGWLLDPAGQRLQKSPWLGYAPLPPIPTLQAGQTISLPVTLATPDTESLPSGRYGLDAVLVQLNLQSDPGTLLLRS